MSSNPESNGRTTLTTLPRPIRLAILAFLDLRNLARLHPVSRAFHSLTQAAVEHLPGVDIKIYPRHPDPGSSAMLAYAAERCTRLRSLAVVRYGHPIPAAPLLQLLRQNSASLTALTVRDASRHSEYLTASSPTLQAIFECKGLTELEVGQRLEAGATERLIASLPRLEVLRCRLDDEECELMFFSSALPLRHAEWTWFRLPVHTPVLLSHRGLQSIYLSLSLLQEGRQFQEVAADFLQLFLGLSQLPVLADLAIEADGFPVPVDAPPVVFPERLQRLKLERMEYPELTLEERSPDEKHALALFAPGARYLQTSLLLSRGALLPAAELMRRFPRLQSVRLFEEVGFGEEDVAPCLEALQQGCWEELSTLVLRFTCLTPFYVPLFCASPQLQCSLTELSLDFARSSRREVLLLLRALPRLRVLSLCWAGQEGGDPVPDDEENAGEGYGKEAGSPFSHPALQILSFEMDALAFWPHHAVALPGLRTLNVGQDSVWRGALLPLLRSAPAVEEVLLTCVTHASLYGLGTAPAVGDEDLEEKKEEGAEVKEGKDEERRERKGPEKGPVAPFFTSLRRLAVWECPNLPTGEILALCTNPAACRVGNEDIYDSAAGYFHADEYFRRGHLGIAYRYEYWSRSYSFPPWCL